MECEESFITIKLIWHSYLVLILSNCTNKLCTETDLRKFKYILILIDASVFKIV